MTAANEALGQQSQMATALEQGIEVIAARESVTFQMFTKLVVSQDGFVFWVASSQYAKVEGALHLGIDRVQEQDQTIAVNAVLLTTEQPIEQFNAVAPDTMWIGNWPVGPQATDGEQGEPLTIQVAFSRSGNFFRQSNQWHYSGFAVYPALSAQIIQTEADLPAGPIVNNSLPIWLAITTFAGQTVPVYASFLVPDNVVPPYIVAHVEPNNTVALQAFPNIQQPGVVVPGTGPAWLYDFAASQLCRDEVELTLYGFNAQMAFQYYVNLIGLSELEGNFGFANLPVIMDAKRTQAEIAALAQKKTLHISANYYQGAADAVARRYILDALPIVSVAPLAGYAGSVTTTATGVGLAGLQYGATGVAI